jgi:hypothetical protein
MGPNSKRKPELGPFAKFTTLVNLVKVAPATLAILAKIAIGSGLA